MRLKDALRAPRFWDATLYVKQAVIPNLSADIITTGNLNADLITVGTLNAARISAGTITVSHLDGVAASKRSIIQMTGSSIPTSQTLLATINMTGLTTTDPVDVTMSGTYTHSGAATGFKIYLKPTHTWLIDTADVDESGTADGTSQAYCKVLDFTNDVQNKGLWSFSLTDWPTTSAPSRKVYGAGVGGSVSYKALFSVVQSYR